jgi:GTPase
MNQKIDRAVIESHELFIGNDGWVGEVDDIFSASDAKEKCQTKHGTVVLTQVFSGTVYMGDRVKLTSDGETVITDTIARLEIDHKEVASATPGQKIGLCLGKTRLRNLREALKN